jgi:protease I
MSGALAGKKVAIVVTDGFEQVELTQLRKALDDAGAQTVLVSPKEGWVSAWNHSEWGDEFVVDVQIARAHASEFDALLLPGGVMSPDMLRAMPEVRAFVRSFFDADKPVAAICHGPWTLIDAGVVKGRSLTSWPSLRTDLENAGATWSDEEIVVDANLVTSRMPDDLPAFSLAIVGLFARGPARATAQHVEREIEIEHPRA